MAVKTENTMAEGLQSLVQQIAAIKMTPDADLGFLVKLETDILQYLHQGMAQQQAAATPGMPSPAQQLGGGMPGMGPGGPGGMPGGQIQLPAGPLAGRQAMNGMSPMSPGAPPTDEIARMLR